MFPYKACFTVKSVPSRYKNERGQVNALDRDAIFDAIADGPVPIEEIPVQAADEEAKNVMALGVHRTL